MGVSFNLREFLDIISVAIATASPPKRALLCPKLRVPPWHSWRHLPPPLCLGTQSFSHRMDNAWKAAARSARRFLGLRLEPRRAHPGHLRIETHAVDIHQTHHWMNLNPSGIKHQPGAFCGLPSFSTAALPGRTISTRPRLRFLAGLPSVLCAVSVRAGSAGSACSAASSARQSHNAKHASQKEILATHIGDPKPCKNKHKGEDPQLALAATVPTLPLPDSVLSVTHVKWSCTALSRLSLSLPRCRSSPHKSQSQAL